MPFEFREAGLEDAVMVEPQVFEDERGFFMETYVRKDFREAGIEADFIQDNFSRSKKNVLRGLHFQKGEHAQAKLVRCVRGGILDVIVDLRKDSPTFSEHIKVELSEENRKMIYVPRGFAHGFLVLSDTAEVCYKVDNDYSPESESGIIWNDPTLDIDWPVENPVLSDDDQELPGFEQLKNQGSLF
ncbi:MAG: dTDP-4-dehydrorhamnose 3,5-epimerase [Candidatus Nanohaloarchaea archaeon]